MIDLWNGKRESGFFFDLQKAGVQSYTYVKNETDFTAELNGNQRHRMFDLENGRLQEVTAHREYTTLPTQQGDSCPHRTLYGPAS